MRVSFKTVSRRPSLTKRRRKCASRSSPGKTLTIGQRPALSLRLMDTFTGGVDGMVPLKPHGDGRPTSCRRVKGELADALRDIGFGIHPGNLLARDRVTLPSQIFQDSRAQPPDARVIRCL